jgi:hypothetical protein
MSDSDSSDNMSLMKRKKLISQQSSSSSTPSMIPDGLDEILTPQKERTKRQFGLVKTKLATESTATVNRSLTLKKFSKYQKSIQSRMAEQHPSSTNTPLKLSSSWADPDDSFNFNAEDSKLPTKKPLPLVKTSISAYTPKEKTSFSRERNRNIPSHANMPTPAKVVPGKALCGPSTVPYEIKEVKYCYIYQKSLLYR